jgi:hypothetical protein
MKYMKISFQEVAEMLAEVTTQFTPSDSALSWTYSTIEQQSMTGHFSLGRDHLISIVYPRPELPLLFTAGILVQELTYVCNFTGWSRDEGLGLRK